MPSRAVYLVTFHDIPGLPMAFESFLDVDRSLMLSCQGCEQTPTLERRPLLGHGIHDIMLEGKPIGQVQLVPVFDRPEHL